ncbi:hypothetical protein [Variovorax saccharolyticus]|uniref:hypothetical protein n=1 Tax=Variovorax saccharolyticus TaxID=3053516 RepID=UPI002578B61D|nr:hypothetical protein [Variovorax sp. J31P216]MDM0024105.1 hypothetical protein [Variovorax sp. J31P216]
MVQSAMLKTKAIELLGGSTATAAEAIGVTYQAVDKWPDELPARIVDRVIAALVKLKKPVPRELLSTPEAKAA